MSPSPSRVDNVRPAKRARQDRQLGTPPCVCSHVGVLASVECVSRGRRVARALSEWSEPVDADDVVPHDLKEMTEELPLSTRAVRWLPHEDLDEVPLL